MFPIDTILLTDAFIAVSICSRATIFVIISIAFEQNWWRSRTECKSFNKKKVSNLTGSRQICICYSKMGSFCLLTFVDDEEGDKNQLDVFSILPVIYILLPSAGVFVLYFKSCHILYFSSFLPYFVFSILPVMAIIRSIATWWGVVRRLTWHNQTSAPNSVLLWFVQNQITICAKSNDDLFKIKWWLIGEVTHLWLLP